MAKRRGERSEPGEDSTEINVKVIDVEKLINKKFGKGTLVKANDPGLRITRVPTGILSVDYLLGGGFARGRHAEIFGSYSVGKTYVTYHTIAAAQALGMKCAFFDCEGTFDPEFAEGAGVDLEELEYVTQDYGEQVVGSMEIMLRGGEYGVIALDSIAALAPKAEQEREPGQAGYGMYQAKLMSEALRRLTAANRSTVLIYINQLREAVGVMFGKKWITSGGKAMSFYAGVRLDMARVETLKVKTKMVDPARGDLRDQNVVTGHRVLLRAEKDKTGGAKTGSTSSFVFDYGRKGVDHVEDLIFLGLVYEYITKSGDKWWVGGFEDEVQHGRARFKKWLEGNEEAQAGLTEAIKEEIYV